LLFGCRILPWSLILMRIMLLLQSCMMLTACRHLGMS
jgi:hypothetical protein